MCLVTWFRSCPSGTCILHAPNNPVSPPISVTHIRGDDATPALQLLWHCLQMPGAALALRGGNLTSRAVNHLAWATLAGFLGNGDLLGDVALVRPNTKFCSSKLAGLAVVQGDRSGTEARGRRVLQG